MKTNRTRMSDAQPERTCEYQPIPLYRPAMRTPARYRVLFGGAGSGKSVFAAMDHLYLARSSPRRRILVLRKVKKTIRLSTFQLFRDLINDWGWNADVTINKNEFRISFEEGGEIVHSGLDDREKLKSITGITDIWIEEATELDTLDITQVDLRLRGLPDDLTGRITYTFNPVNEARRVFDYIGVDLESLPNRTYKTYADAYVQHSTYKDNPYAGKAYEIAMGKLEGSMDVVYRLGKLSQVDEPDQVIPYSFVQRGKEADPKPGTRYMGVDAAHYGRDRTAYAFIKGNVLEGIEVHDNLTTTRSAGIVGNHIGEKRITPRHVGVDGIGIGAGVVDTLQDAGYQIVNVKSGASAIDDESSMEYNNLRSQMWWLFREALRKAEVSLQYCPQELAEDLCAPRYTIVQGKTVKVESKEKIKRRLGRSTDLADAVIYAWAVKTLDLQSESVGAYQTVKA